MNIPAQRPRAGLLDTNILISLSAIAIGSLPDESAISSVTLAELAAGVHAARTPTERALRLLILQNTERQFDPLPFDGSAAHAYGRVWAAQQAVGRTARRRAADLMIASIAIARGLPLYTMNPRDFAGLDSLLEVVEVSLGQEQSS